MPDSAFVSAPAPPDATLVHMRAAFQELYNSEYHQLVRFVMLNGANAPAAHDAAQDAFTDAWELTTQPGRWEAIRNPCAWLRTVALRKYSRPPGARRRPPTVPLEQIPDRPVEDHSNLSALTLDVLAALQSLDADTRAVIAFTLDGFTAPEIAAELGMRVQKVRDLIKKGRKQLRRTLGGTR